MNKGFTLVELLAVIIILGLLLVIAIPSYISIYSGIKRDTLENKISEIESSALSYGSTIKDEVKNSSCVTKSIEDLIKYGNLTSDKDSSDVIIDPTKNKPMTGNVLICYDKEKLDIVANYVVPYEQNKLYFKNEKVNIGNKVYRCIEDINTQNYDIENLHQFTLVYTNE